MKKMGFYGGTFDPPHLGHLHVVSSLLERGVVDEITICPTSYSHLKPFHLIAATNQERLEMVKIQFSSMPKVSIDEGEIFQKGPVYTIDTLRRLKKTFPEAGWHLILGEDAACQLPLWKEWESLIQEFPLIICPREIGGKEAKILPMIEKSKVDIPLREISSTEIKERLIKNLFCDHLVDRKVLDFIKQNSLYSGPYG